VTRDAGCWAEPGVSPATTIISTAIAGAIEELLVVVMLTSAAATRNLRSFAEPGKRRPPTRCTFPHDSDILRSFLEQSINESSRERRLIAARSEDHA
jgi:hypothetical protein